MAVVYSRLEGRHEENLLADRLRCLDRGGCCCCQWRAHSLERFGRRWLITVEIG